MTDAQLRDLYNCVGSPSVGANGTVVKLPQFGSGTRSTFIKNVLMLEDDNISWTSGRPCISEESATGVPLLENDGTLLSDRRIIAPYSCGKWLAQQNRVIADKRGRTILGLVNGVPCALPNPDQKGARTVYNVIPTNKEAVAPTSTVFVGSDSEVCKNRTEIARQGFGPLPDGVACGNTSIKRGTP